MQNNAEQIFDDFLRSRLDDVIPDTSLLDTSYSSFLQERNGRKRRNRFFWLIFLLLFISLPFIYYISGINQSGIQKPGSQKLKTSIQPIDSDMNEQKIITGIIADSAADETKNNNPTQAVLPGKKIPSGSTSDVKADAKAQNSHSLNNDLPDSTIAKKIKTNTLQLSKTDSLEKKVNSQKADTFHIVW